MSVPHIHGRYRTVPASLLLDTNWVCRPAWTAGPIWIGSGDWLASDDMTTASMAANFSPVEWRPVARRGGRIVRRMILA